MVDAKPKAVLLPGSHVYNGMVFDRFFPAAVLDRIKDFEFREGDVLVSGYPKSGTTWTNEMVWLAVNDIDLEGAKKGMEIRIPILEQALPMMPPFIDMLKERDSPRVISTHLPVEFLLDQIKRSNVKVIYIVRNPKDMLVSWYHFYSLIFSKMLELNWDEFFETFREKKLSFGDWFEHTLGWWDQKHLENMLFITYEDAKRDHHGTVKKITEFLGKCYSEEQIEAIVEHTSFSSMKENPATNKAELMDKLRHEKKEGAFIRKGKVGDWKTLFSDEQSQYVDKMYEEKISKIGLVMMFE